jgi:hypothetical protein
LANGYARAKLKEAEMGSYGVSESIMGFHRHMHLWGADLHKGRVGVTILAPILEEWRELLVDTNILKEFSTPLPTAFRYTRWLDLEVSLKRTQALAAHRGIVVIDRQTTPWKKVEYSIFVSRNHHQAWGLLTAFPDHSPRISWIPSDKLAALLIPQSMNLVNIFNSMADRIQIACNERMKRLLAVSASAKVFELGADLFNAGVARLPEYRK